MYFDQLGRADKVIDWEISGKAAKGTHHFLPSQLKPSSSWSLGRKRGA